MKSAYLEMQNTLKSLAETKYRDFSASLLPGTENVLGVRLPKLRELARELAKGDWRGYFQENRHEFFEETMLQGLTIGYLKDIDEVLEQTSAFVPKITSWSLCDSFCAGLKLAKTDRERFRGFLEPYLKSDEPFSVRFAVVMLLNYYIVDDCINDTLTALDGVRNEDYYVKMAVAWALSLCYVRFQERTMEYFKVCNLDDFTYNKALQKACESRRVGAGEKLRLQGMKRRN